ncbi:unnamed protein product, partial [Ectocarpus sp. 12 AP-2014]
MGHKTRRTPRRNIQAQGVRVEVAPHHRAAFPSQRSRCARRDRLRSGCGRTNTKEAWATCVAKECSTKAGLARVCVIREAKPRPFLLTFDTTITSERLRLSCLCAVGAPFPFVS